MVQSRHPLDDLDEALCWLGGVYDRAELSPSALRRLAALPKMSKASLGRMARTAFERMRMPEGAVPLGEHELNAAIGGMGDVPVTESLSHQAAPVTEPQDPPHPEEDDSK